MTTTTPADHATGYHESPRRLRRQLRTASAEWDSRIHADDNDAFDDAAMMAASYAYTLAALLGWVGREHGPDAEHAAACMVDDVLTNGDCADLNGDLRSGEATTGRETHRVTDAEVAADTYAGLTGGPE